MREIKFRAWDRKSKSMEKEVGVSFMGMPIDWISGEVFLNPEDMIVMQYIGLLDKNGVAEVYEGDYLEISEVDDNSKTWCVFWGSGKYILHNISTGDIIDCNEENIQDKEVTGNRYENPREHKAMASDL